MSKRTQQAHLDLPVDDGNACAAWEDTRADLHTATSSSASSHRSPGDDTDTRESFSHLSSKEMDDEFMAYSKSQYRVNNSVSRLDMAPASEESPTPFLVNGENLFIFLEKEAMALYNPKRERPLTTFRAQHTSNFINAVSESKEKRKNGKHPLTVSVFGGKNCKPGMIGLKSGSAAVTTENMRAFVQAMAHDIAAQSYPQISFMANKVDYCARLVFDFDLHMEHTLSFPDAFLMVLSMYTTRIVSSAMSTYEKTSTLTRHDMKRMVSAVTAIRKSVSDDGTYQAPIDSKVGMHIAFDIFCSVADAVILRQMVLQRLQADFVLGEGSTLYLIDQGLMADTTARDGGDALCMWKFVTSDEDVTDADVRNFGLYTNECMMNIFTSKKDFALRDANGQIINIPLESFFDVKPITSRMLRPPWTFKSESARGKSPDKVLKNMYVPMLATKFKGVDMTKSVVLHAMKPSKTYAEAMIPLLIPNAVSVDDLRNADIQPIFLRHPSMHAWVKKNEIPLVQNALRDEETNYSSIIAAQSTEIPAAKKASVDTYFTLSEKAEIQAYQRTILNHARSALAKRPSTVDKTMSENIITFVEAHIGGDMTTASLPAQNLGRALAMGVQDKLVMFNDIAQFPHRELLEHLTSVKATFTMLPLRDDQLPPYVSTPIASIVMTRDMTRIELLLKGKMFCHVKGGIHNAEAGKLIFFVGKVDTMWRVMFKCKCIHKDLSTAGRRDCQPGWTGCGAHDWGEEKERAPIIDVNVGLALHRIVRETLEYKRLSANIQSGRTDEVCMRIANATLTRNTDAFGDRVAQDGTPMALITSVNYVFM